VHKKTTNQIRVIAGKWRGRKIHFEDAQGLRPTSDRIRETLFNWLASYIEQAHCIDLFAGSGALGIEALSRGALSVSFVDTNDKAIKQIKTELERFSAGNYHLYTMGALEFINSPTFLERSCNIIFLDPPYQLEIFEQCIATLEQVFQQNSKTAEQVFIYYEHSKKLDATQLPKNWLILKQKKAGQVHFYLFKRQSTPNSTREPLNNVSEAVKTRAEPVPDGPRHSPHPCGSRKLLKKRNLHAVNEYFEAVFNTVFAT